MHRIKSTFDKMMCALKETLGNDSAIFNNEIKPGPKKRFSDLEVIALACTAEFLGHSSENYFFSLIDKNEFPTLLSRRQFNDRRKTLILELEKVRQCVVSKIQPSVKDVFIVDSMPLKICRYPRRHRNQIGKGQEFCPDVGYCAAQEEKFYGFKLHSACTVDGVIQTVDFTQASVHDVNYLKDISENFSNCTIIGDKGYVSQYYKELLKEKSNIRLITENRKNQKVIEMMPPEYKGKRKKIETIFSQLTDQFNIQKNYSKSMNGYFSRIMSKITSMTIINYINQSVNNKPLSQIKYAI